MRSVSTLTVTWDAGADENTGFAVKLQGENEHPIAAGTKGSHKFTGLTAGREYTVVVVTTSGDQRSESRTGKFHISKSLAVSWCLLALLCGQSCFHVY